MKIHGWRIAAHEPFGLTCWFDPDSEELSLRSLTVVEKADRVDRIGSVSAMGEGEDGSARDPETGEQLVLFEDEFSFK